MTMIIISIIGALIVCIVFVSILILASPKSKKDSNFKVSSDFKANQNLSQNLFYKKCSSLLTNNELAFYRALLPIATSKNLVIFSKVRIADLIKPAQKENWQTAFNKIKSKHIDFVLCDKITTYPILAIELDDLSHQKPDRQQRDIFVDKAFASAGLPIIHTLSSIGLAEKIDAHIKYPKKDAV